MNRYRTMPGLGPQKASASTVCQKCLKKDMSSPLKLLSTINADMQARHYSYECKASTQERPYISRPSRTQQFLNPRLLPKLSSDNPNSLLNSKGVADKQLAEAEALRNEDSPSEQGGRGRVMSSRGNSRSRSISSDSVSTVSTNKSRSSTPSDHRIQDSHLLTGGGANRSRTPPSRSHGKRKHRSLSSSRSRSPLPRKAPGSHRKSRRHRTISPIDRGRPSSVRRGSHRSRTNSLSMDISQVTKHRRSMDSENEFGDRRANAYQHNPHRGRHRGPSPGLEERYTSGNTNLRTREPRKERSLSPYSKRLALTQAMNM